MSEKDARYKAAISWARALQEKERPLVDWLRLMVHAPAHAKTLLDYILVLSTRLEQSAEILIDDAEEAPTGAIPMAPADQMEVTLSRFVRSMEEAAGELKAGLQSPGGYQQLRPRKK